MSKKMILSILAGVLLLGTTANPASAATYVQPQRNLIVNGGFEISPNFSGEYENIKTDSIDIEGWKVHFGDVDVVQKPSWAASEGNRCIDLNGYNPGGICQRIATEPGVTYQLSFSMAGHTSGAPIKRMNVRVAGQTRALAFTVVGKTPTNMGWERKSLTFTATQPSTDIEFISATPSGYYGPMIDNVVVVKSQAASVNIHPAIERTDTATILSVPSDILFDENQSVLRPTALSALKTVFERDIRPNLGTHIKINGYTDDSGEPLYNLTLSSKRALAVASWLSTAGCNPNQIDITGYGENNPKVANTTDGRALNRRVEIVLQR